MIELTFPDSVKDRKDFFGRKVELGQIEHTVLSNSNRLVSILGERRIGKTSLQMVSAKCVAAKSEGRIVPLFLPPARNICSLNDYAKEILRSLCSFTSKNLRETRLPDEVEQFQLTTVGDFGDAVIRLLKGAAPQTFLICIDELDTIMLESARVESDQILGLTEYIIEKADLPIILSITMTRLPDTESDAFGSSSILTGEIIKLDPFCFDEMAEMVRNLLGDEVVLAYAAMESLFRLSGGHPYITKLLLDRLLKRYGSEGTTLAVTPAMVKQVVLEAVDDPRAQPILTNIYKIHFTLEEQQLVLLLAERLKAGGRTGVTTAELEVLGPAFQKAAKALTRHGYLIRGAEGGCGFRIEFLGWWILNWEEYEEEAEQLLDIKQRFKIT